SDLERGVLERAVDPVEDEVVLPQADAEADDERGDADDEARAELVEVLDEAQAILVPDRPQRAGHPARRSWALSAARTRRRPTRRAAWRTRPPGARARRWPGGDRRRRP